MPKNKKPTESVESLLRLEHLNQVLHAIRDINQLITHERDVQRLMQEACNILVRTQDYKFVWIGQPVDDRLKPIASAGEGRDFIELVFTTASREQAERLPGAESFRTKQPVICHDISNDVRYAPWREEIQRRNLFSRAAIPMMNGERFFGVLSVYSERAAIFDKDETSLLMELAGDLAFGLSSIEEELERQQAEEKLRESEKRYRGLFEHMSEGYAYCEMIFEDGRPLDWIYHNVNEAFEKLTGLKDVTGKRVTEVIPGIHETDPELFDIYGRVSLTGKHEKFEIFVEALNMWFSISVYGPEKGFFVAVFDVITERKRAEDALREAEKKYRTIFDGAVEGIFQSTPAGRFLAVNPALAHMWGYKSPEELITSIKDITRQVYAEPNRRAEFSRLVQKDDEVHGFEYQARRKDGSIMWVSENARAVRDASGKLLYYEGNIEDITERKQAEDALQASEARFHSLFENAPVGVLLADTQGNILEVNPAIVQILGSPSAEATRTINILNFQPLIEAGISADFQECARTAQPLSSEHIYVTKWGKSIDLNMRFTPLVEADGKTTLLQILLEDVTERKRAEEKLRESEAELKEAQRLGRLGSWDWDAKADTITWSEEYYQIYGFDPKQPPPGYEEHLKAYTPESAARLDAAVKKSLETGAPYKLDLEQARPDGTRRWVTARSEIKRDVNDQIIGLRGTAQDITDRRQAEERIKRQLEQLTALNEIDRMIASSFDLHLSLTSIVDRVIPQLKVDAADILVMNPDLNILEFGAGHGFHTLGIEKGHLSLGEGYAGRAALERQIIHIPDLRAQVDNPIHRKTLASENFVGYYAVPLIAKGKVKGVLEIFHRSPLDPDFEWLDFLNTLAGQAALAIDNVTLFGNLQRSNTELALAYDATIEGWSRALDLRDKESEGHSLRVTEMVLSLASKFGIKDSELVQVRWGALLHDIGKMGLPDSILFKSDALTEQEWVSMRSHPVLAYKLLSPIGFLRSTLDIPYCHHEKWDGTGYPRGLKGEQIPLAARIFAVIDVWDALTSDRVYRKAWSNEKALDYIKSQAGTHFDPHVVKICFESGVLERKNQK